MNLSKKYIAFYILLAMALLCACKQNDPTSSKKETEQIGQVVPLVDSTIIKENGMILIPGGAFEQGAIPGDRMAMHHEKPSHRVTVNPFYMKATEVTNSEFQKFVAATGYQTVAERALDWQELRKQLPSGTPKPHDSLLQPGSLVFQKTQMPVTDFRDVSQWWVWTVGASWKHPHGPGSSIQGKENHPVVHIAYEDARAYCNWLGARLPTEAEWEYAARGGMATSTPYPWDATNKKLAVQANTWTGTFPINNDENDGYEGTAPVGSYPPNKFGLYDMSGNVWEWTNDWYHTQYYAELTKKAGPIDNPKGAATAFNPNNPYAKEKVIKGGSFLCNASYCASYRISARMANTLDSAQEHLGFRIVMEYNPKK